MVSEGLAEVLHAAARGESITCLMLDNGVFGDTGGQMTAATTVGQRTKTDLEGRSAAEYGHPIDGRRHRGVVPRASRTSRAARSTSPTRSPARVATCARRSRSQLAGEGFSLVEMLTMCPTGWAVPTDQGAQYQRDQMNPTFPSASCARAPSEGRTDAGRPDPRHPGAPGAV